MPGPFAEIDSVSCEGKMNRYTARPKSEYARLAEDHRNACVGVSSDEALTYTVPDLLSMGATAFSRGLLLHLLTLAIVVRNWG